MIRQGGNVPISASTVSELDADEIERQLEVKGTGTGVDLGMNISLPLPIRPVMSVVWRNAGGLSFRPEETGGASPPSDKNEIIVGFSALVDLPFFDLAAAADFKHINRDEEQIGKKLHLGLEVGLPLIDLRVGFHQGYLSYGAGIGLGLIQVDAASYGVELGAFPGQLEDRRYIVQATIELGINPFIDIGGSGSSSGRKRRVRRRRGIKQRR